MKYIVFTLLAIAFTPSAFALEGYLCRKETSSIAFIPDSQADESKGTLVVKLPGQPAAFYANALRSWSGSMFIINANGTIVQGPGSGVMTISLMDQNSEPVPNATFDVSSDCVFK